MKYLKYFFVILFFSINVLADDTIMLGPDNPPDGLPSTINNGDYGQVINSTFTIEADGYYLNLNNNKLRDASDSPRIYGKWFNTGMSLVRGQQFSVKISGDVSRSYSTIFKFDPTISEIQSSRISFQQGDSLELLINNKLPNGANATNYVSNYPCINSPPDRCKDKNGNDQGPFSIDGAGPSIMYGNKKINDSTKNFVSQNSIDSSIGTGGFNKNGLFIHNLLSSNILQFQTVDVITFDDNIGNYAFKIKKIFNSINNAKVSKNEFGTVDYTIYSSDPNKDLNGYEIINLSSNAATNYNSTASNSGTLWLRIHDNAPIPYYSDSTYNQNIQLKYFNLSFDNSNFSYNNIGRYFINVSQTIDDVALSQLINNLLTKIKKPFSLASSTLYQNIISNTSFKNIIKNSIILYIMVYAITFMFGIVQVTQSDLVHRIFNMGVLFALIATDTSWNFFSNYLFNAFLHGNEYLISSTTGDDSSSGTSNLFRFIDISVGKFFTKYAWIKISALLFTPPSGTIMACMMIYGVCVYSVCILEVVIGYIMSIIAISFTIAIAPLLFACLLFQQTKTYFNNWLNYLYNFALQPVMLFAVVYLVYDMLLISFQKSIAYTVTWGCAIHWQIPIPITNSSIKFCNSYYNLSTNTNWASVFIEIFIFLMFIKIIKGMLEFAPLVVSVITGTAGAGVKITGRGSEARAQIDKGKDIAMKASKLDEASKFNRKISRAVSSK